MLTILLATISGRAGLSRSLPIAPDPQGRTAQMERNTKLNTKLNTELHKFGRMFF